jgi:serine/threonine protein kinase
MGCCQKKKINEPLINENDSKDTEESNNYENLKLSYSDFEPLKLLGTGSFGRVLLVRYKNNNNLYAMKILSKTQIKIRKQEEHTKTERNLMVRVNCPFVVNIKFAFQDESRLYIVSDFMQGGDMFYHLHSGTRKFPESKAKFYIIELILGIEFLHKQNIIYRDLKPENILMDFEGHIKISDFGLSKILDDSDEKTFTLCGTPQYISPEVLKNKGYDKTIDWWALGVILYEMLTGFLPFRIPKGNKINPKLYEEPVQFPSNINPLAIDLIKQLLNPNPKKRLGHGDKGAQSIKQHDFFKGVDWNKYWNKKIQPPFIPELSGETDLKYFDKMFTDEPVNNERPTIMSRSRSNEYQGFTFVTQSIAREMKTFANDNEVQIGEEISQQSI